MITSKNREKNIFCIEGDWDDDLKNKRSINSALKFLEDSSDIKYIHRNCSTKEEFDKRMEEFIQPKYDDYTIFYLAFHGFRSGIQIGDYDISLDDIADKFENKLSNKMIHFGSCSTLDIDLRHIKRFIKKTNALCVSGFKKEVDFIPSTMFDILYFEMCQQYKRVTYIDNGMNYYYRQLCKELEFRMIYI